LDDACMCCNYDTDIIEPCMCVPSSPKPPHEQACDQVATLHTASACNPAWVFAPLRALFHLQGLLDVSSISRDVKRCLATVSNFSSFEEVHQNRNHAQYVGREVGFLESLDKHRHYPDVPFLLGLDCSAKSCSSGWGKITYRNSKSTAEAFLRGQRRNF
jgi:hypothetical protein